MRKFLLVLLSTAAFLLVSCGSRNVVSLKDVEPMFINGMNVTPEKAVLEDEALTLTIKWKKGSDSDSMTKNTFSSLGTLFTATQNGKQVEWDIANSDGLNDDVYEGSEDTVYPVFNLSNTSDDVTITIFNGQYPDTSQNFVVKLPK